MSVVSPVPTSLNIALQAALYPSRLFPLIPSDWTGRTAYDAFRAVADSLDKKGKVNGTLRYRYYIPLVRNVYGAYETEVAGAQAATEAAAARLTGTAQSTYLTNYSTQRATQAENLAKSLPAQMP